MPKPLLAHRATQPTNVRTFIGKEHALYLCLTYEIALED